MPDSLTLVISRWFSCSLGGLAVFALVMAMSGTAHGESRPRYGTVLDASLLGEPSVIDPIEARSHTELAVVSLFFDTLYTVRGGKVYPHLAATLPQEVSPTRVVIPLRAGVKFHDGTPLGAEDVIQSLERLRKSSLGFLLEGVRGIEALTPGEGETVVRIALDLRAADPALASRLTGLHTAIVKRGSAPTWQRIGGTGPWKLRKRSRGEALLSLRPNHEHFAGRPFLDGMTLRWHTSADAEARAYEAGTSHISARGAIAFAGHRPKFATERVDVDVQILSFLGFGVRKPLLREAEFRRAMSLAVGRSGMRQIGSGERVSPTTTVLAPKRAPRAFALRANPRGAKALLAPLASRYPVLATQSLSLEILVNASRPDDAVVAARVAAGLYSVGIATQIVSVAADVFQERARKGECDLYIGQLAPGGSLLTASGQPGLTYLRKAFAIGGQVTLAKKLYRASRPELERLFASKMPIVPLFHRGLRLHHRSNVRGVGLSGARTLDYPGLFMHGDSVKN